MLENINYHNIVHDDMSNGEGLRVTLFISGCEHQCDGCHNPQTWDSSSGIPLDKSAILEIENSLKQDYIEGLTISGGDPLYCDNLEKIFELVTRIRKRFPNKSIWIYTGYYWEDLYPESAIYEFDVDAETRRCILELIDVLVDGKFEKDKTDVNYKWAGSTNQRVIDVQKSLGESLVLNEIVLYKSEV